MREILRMNVHVLDALLKLLAMDIVCNKWLKDTKCATYAGAQWW